MVQIILLVLLIGAIVLMWAVIAAIGVALFYGMLAIALVTVLVAHGRVYFMDKRHGVAKTLIYIPVLLGMLGTAAAMTPGLRSGFEHMVVSTTPWLAVPFALAAVYYAFGLRLIGADLVHPYCAGAVYVDQIRASVRALPGVWEGAKRAAPWVFAHWVGIIAGLAALVIGVPIALGVLIVSTLVGLLVAVAWGAFLAIPMAVLMLVFRFTRKAGARVACLGCGKEHVVPGPGPWGLFHVRCACGQTLDLWAVGSEAGEREAIPVWHSRGRNLGAQSMLSLSCFAAIGLVFLPKGMLLLGTPAAPIPPPAAATAPAPVPAVPVRGKGAKLVASPKRGEPAPRAEAVAAKPVDPFAVRDMGPGAGKAQKTPPSTAKPDDPFAARE